MERCELSPASVIERNLNRTTTTALRPQAAGATELDRLRRVRFTPGSEQAADVPDRQLCANICHWLHKYAAYELIHTMIDISSPMTPAFSAKTVAVPGIPTLNCALSIPSGIEITAG